MTLLNNKTSNLNPKNELAQEGAKSMSHQIELLMTTVLQLAWSAHFFNRLELHLKWMGRWPPPWKGAPYPSLGEITHQTRILHVYPRDQKETA